MRKSDAAPLEYARFTAASTDRNAVPKRKRKEDEKWFLFCFVCVCNFGSLLGRGTDSMSAGTNPLPTF